MRRHAILIANDTFPKAGEVLPPLKTVRSDIEGMKVVLNDLRGKFDHIEEIYNQSTRGILKSVKDALKKVKKKGELVLIYYAGHGRVFREKDFRDKFLLSTFDSKPEPDYFNCDLQWSSLEQLLLDSTKVNRAVVILDCCYSGMANTDEEPRGGVELPISTSTIVGDEYTTLEAGDSKDKLANAGDNEGIYLFAACGPKEQAFGDKRKGNGEFTHQLLKSLKSIQEDPATPSTIERVFEDVHAAMEDSKQTPSLSRRDGNGPLEIARDGIHGEGEKKTLNNWKPVPINRYARLDSMVPTYILDAGFRFKHWNPLFGDVIAEQLGLVIGCHAVEFVEGLANKNESLNRDAFPTPDEDTLEKASKTGEIWEGFPITDVEPLEFVSERFGLLVFDKLAYQIPEPNFGRRRHWHVQLNLRFAQRHTEYFDNAMSVKLDHEMWNEYADSYDRILSPSPKYAELLKDVIEHQNQHSVKNCLDIGSGTGNSALALLEADPDRHVTCVEFNDKMLAILKDKLEEQESNGRAWLLKGDAKTVVERIETERGRLVEEDLKRKFFSVKSKRESQDGLFDGCVMLNVLYVLDNPDECLKAIYRVLKPGGVLTISTPVNVTDEKINKVFDEIKTQLKPDQSGQWLAWESCRKVNKWLLKKPTLNLERARALVEDAQFQITEDPYLKFEDNVLIIRAKKPELSQVVTTPPSEIEGTQVEISTPETNQVAENDLAEVLETTESTPITDKAPVKLFISYARKDGDLAANFIGEIKTRLRNARDFDVTFFKDDEDVLLGDEWDTIIQQALNDCQAAILLVSPNFLTSEYIVDKELAIFERSDKLVFPVMLRHINLDDDDLKGLQKKQFFKYREKPFADFSGKSDQDSFIAQLYGQIVRQLKKLLGSTN